MKQYFTIGCCGIDCGLCPRYHTDGSSACPGCAAPDFKEKHPSCGFLTCCVTKHGVETCADCPDYPCSRFDKEREGRDSFVTHRKVFDNLNTIRDKGLNEFLQQQSKRIHVLKQLLANYNDGRSKSYFCLACALLPEEDLESTLKLIRYIDPALASKDKARQVRALLDKRADQLKIDLTLRH